MNILGIDVETTGIDAENNEIVELGLVLLNVDRNTGSEFVISSNSLLFQVNKICSYNKSIKIYYSCAFSCEDCGSRLEKSPF